MVCPFITIACAVATNDSAVVVNILGLNKDSDRCSAAVPEFTATTCLQLR